MVTKSKNGKLDLDGAGIQKKIKTNQPNDISEPKTSAESDDSPPEDKYLKEESNADLREALEEMQRELNARMDQINVACVMYRPLPASSKIIDSFLHFVQFSAVAPRAETVFQ